MKVDKDFEIVWKVIDLIVSLGVFVIWLGWFTTGSSLSFILSALVGINFGRAFGGLFL